MHQRYLLVPVENTGQSRIDLQAVKLVLGQVYILRTNGIEHQEVKNYPCYGYVHFHVRLPGFK